MFPRFMGTEELWELLTRKNVNTQFIGKEDLKSYKKILTNSRLTRYQPRDNINITLGRKFREVIAPLFAKRKGHGEE